VKPAASVHQAVTVTVIDDRTSPTNDIAANGTTCAARGRPTEFHTHLRFSSNDGPIPAIVARRFAQPGEAVPVATRLVRITRLKSVTPIDTTP